MLAVSVGLLAYIVVLKAQRGAAREAPARPEALTIAPLPTARPLPPAPEFGPKPATASAAAGRATTSLLVQLHHLPKDLPTTAGLATFDAATGADLAWLPLRLADRERADSVAIQVVAPASDGFITFALEPDLARHGYVVRAAFEAAAHRAQTIELDATTTAVNFTLPPRATFCGPFRLQRVDDPHWLLQSCAMTVSAGADARPVTLGRGDYELCDPITPERRQRFTVPGSREVAISAELARVRADRP